MATPAELRLRNQRAILDRLMTVRSATRAQLAHDLHLSPPTAGKLIADLISRGLLEEFQASPSAEEAARPGTIGRPGRPIRLATRSGRLLLIDLGVRTTRVGLLAVGGAIHEPDEQWDARFPTGADAAGWVTSLGQALRELAPSDVRGAVLSVPGLVDEEAGRVLFSPNLHWTIDQPLAAMVQRVVHTPVTLVQEISVLALGHRLASGDDDFFLCDLDDGVGGAAVAGGRLLQSALPMLGELGHTPVAGHALPCGCGGRGCLETLLSRDALTRAGRDDLDASADRLVGRQPLAAGRIPAWLTERLDALALGLAGAINVLGLRHVVITGTLATLGPAAEAHLTSRLRATAMWARFGEVTCRFAPRRRAAGLLVAGMQRIIAPVDAYEHRRVASVPQAAEPTRRDLAA